MLTERIIATVQFFDLQDLPLTAFEIERYLISEREQLRSKLDEQFELQDAAVASPPVHLDTILKQLETLVDTNRLESEKGFYVLPGRTALVNARLINYVNGIPRERTIRRYMWAAGFLPFVRGIALAGSQALGQQRKTSDIDLLIITDPEYMWTARTFLMIYFQLLGVRRHGKKIANRVCLNHYLGNAREVDAERNLYKAMEYAKLRLLVHCATIRAFQKANEQWIRVFFPNVEFEEIYPIEESAFQRFAERIFRNRFGLWIELRLQSWQKSRIRQDQFVFVREDELSFHPESKHETLLEGFFQK